MKTRPWIDASVPACYPGLYEVEYGDGRRSFSAFTDGRWADDGFAKWRGISVKLSDKARKKLKKTAAVTHGSGFPEDASRAAVQLGRHYAVTKRGNESFFMYQLAIARHAKLSDADRYALDRAAGRISPKRRAKTEATLKELGVFELASSKRL